MKIEFTGDADDTTNKEWNNDEEGDNLSVNEQMTVSMLVVMKPLNWVKNELVSLLPANVLDSAHLAILQL